MTIRANARVALALRPADVAWLLLIAYVVAYNCSARSEETLSEGMDRYLIGRRWPTELALALVYTHLSNRVPSRLDPLHWAFTAARRVTFWWQGR